MKPLLAFSFALVVLTAVPSIFGQATSVKRIARQIKTPPSAEPTNGVSKPTPPASARTPNPAAAPANPTPWYAPPPREKTKAEKEEAARKALEFQKKQAEEGSPTAQYDLGMRYLNGDGVERNPEAAKKWFELAAKQDHTQAKRQLEQISKAPAK